MQRYIASVSFGKDSLAMLLQLIYRHYPLTEVVFYDAGEEFDCIYRLRDKVLPILNANGIQYTELKSSNSFEYKMFDKPVKSHSGKIHYGYSWCGGVCRWGTTDKLQAIEKYCKGAVEYVGIAYDEPKRIAKERNGQKVFPLFDWGMTERDCLKLCYRKGFNWNENGVELYQILKRVSCWCCANKNLTELKNYYKYLPKYWERLKEIQRRLSRPMKREYSVFDLEKRFSKSV